MKIMNRVEGALLGAVFAGVLGQIPPFTAIPEEIGTIPIGVALGFIWGPNFIKKIKKDLF